VQVVALIQQDSVLEACLHLGLQENVKLSLQLTLVLLGQWLSSGLLLDHFGAKAEDRLLEAISKLKILGQLSEFSQEFLTACLCYLLHVASLLYEGSLSLE